ncbi:MAG: c-type cytochrome [Pseudomonadota bacterium]
MVNTMATGKVVVGFFAVVVGSAVAMPPLTTLPDAAGRATRKEEQRLTGLAQIGSQEYAQTCAACHGGLGEGTARAPTLQRRALLDWPRTQRSFHAHFGGKGAVHGGLAYREGLGFNEIERIAKYLREARRKPEA